MYSVAILVETANAYSRGIVEGISRYIFENGPWNIYYEERALDSPSPTWLKTWHGDGIIVRSRNPKLTQLALQTGASVVDLGENRIPGVPTIYPDYDGCSRLAVEHLKQREFRHFAYLGIAGRNFSQRRMAAFKNYARDSESVSVLEMAQRDLTKSPFQTNHGLGDWLQKLPKPCGLMVCYDLLGIYVIQACLASSIRIPEDIAVVGVNNDEIQCLMTPIPLSSVVQDTNRAGREAAALLQSLMDGAAPPETPKIIPPLYVEARQSTDTMAVQDSLVKNALVIIRERGCLGITVQEIVEELSVSRRLLERRFTQTLNHSIHDEIRRVQMNRAWELLRGSSLTLDTIARRIGFSAASHFSAAFKDFYNRRPGEVREASRQGRD